MKIVGRYKGKIELLRADDRKSESNIAAGWKYLHSGTYTP